MAPGMWLFFMMVGRLMAALAEERLGVRLVNGSSRCDGTVEVRLRTAWEPACGALWDGRAAEAVCRALGCGGAQRPVQPVTPSGEPPPRPAMGNATRTPAILCHSAEWRRCKVLDQECSGDWAVAQVTCAETRAVRLVGGGGRCEGRVELLEGDQWGSVCDDTWDLHDGHVVCRQLGCGWAVQALPGLHFTPGRGPIHRDQVNCSGTEAYLWDCPGMPGAGYCGHKEDAGVRCSEHQSWRLTGSADPCHGQVEVDYHGVWSTVCDSEWYSPEAEVLCQSLGCGPVDSIPKGLPHSLAGRMYYSCTGGETTLAECSWRFNNSNLCSQSLAAKVFCSGSHNLSSPEVPASLLPVTVESSVTTPIESKESWELILLISCIVLGVLLLGSLLSTAILLLKAKGKYALPAMVSHPPTGTPAGINSYQEPPSTVPKEEAPKLSLQTRAPPPEDSESDSDYEHYDFSAQPPVALTTFYNSQRYHITNEEAQQSRFQMPPLEEGVSEAHASHLSPADPLCPGPQSHPGPCSSSSTSSGEDYCNSPSSKPPLWTPNTFSSERSPLLQQPPNLELAGSQPILSGPAPDDSSSTSSGEWYQNFQPPPQPPSVEQLGCPGSPSPRSDSADSSDYDDIGAT
ncbi:T-cell differentiation antigen CD6 [Echinops telfairi]|uniref:T-cell differentiation antigen CD6 n=1 Tax=Echinops telfairi TaxID=9371 RepID=A0ABM0ZTD6_ECHTE|nr:T-cell differentiation antigen CD6 [Echinops telfairi]